MRKLLFMLSKAASLSMCKLKAEKRPDDRNKSQLCIQIFSLNLICWFRYLQMQANAVYALSSPKPMQIQTYENKPGNYGSSAGHSGIRMQGP